MSTLIKCGLSFSGNYTNIRTGPADMLTAVLFGGRKDDYSQNFPSLCCTNPWYQRQKEAYTVVAPELEAEEKIHKNRLPTPTTSSSIII